MSRVAVVVHRYVEGGAEALARMVAERLAARHTVTVLTTRARDFLTWADELPEGRLLSGGVEVIRFSVPIPRDPRPFHAAHARVLSGAYTAADERRFLAEQGPISPDLLGHLREHGREYDAVIFVTALYATTTLGLPLVAERSVLVPTLHDEPPMRLAVYARVMPMARFVLYSAPEERDLAHRLYRMPSGREAIAGVGITPPPVQHGAASRLGIDRPYLFCAGRVDLHKGSGELLRHFRAWCSIEDGVDLVLAGRHSVTLPSHPRIHSLGFVDRATLGGLMSGALATVVPSRMESLSLAALESLALGVPIVVPGDSPVLAGHARRSRAGLTYDDGATFVEACSLLLDNPRLRGVMGDCGRRYVAANYSWERVDAVYERALAAVECRSVQTTDRGLP